jgi:hypothetical protein
MQVIAILSLVMVVLWFGFSGLNRSNRLWEALLWAIIGGVSFWAVLGISSYLIDMLLTYSLSGAVALNGIYVLTMICAISIGLGASFLIYKVTPLGRAAA